MSFHDTSQQPAPSTGVVPDGAKQPAPARMRTDPDSVDRRGASCIRLARGQSGARTAPAPTRARARTQMRAVKGLRCRAGAPDECEPNERSRRTSCPSSSLPPPPTGEPSASATMTKRELTCHSMTRRNSPPVLPASSRTPGVIPAGAQQTGPHRQATRPRRPATWSRSPASAAAGTASAGSKGPAPSTRPETGISHPAMTFHDTARGVLAAPPLPEASGRRPELCSRRSIRIEPRSIRMSPPPGAGGGRAGTG